MVNPTRILRQHATAIVVVCLVWLCFQSVAVACPTCAEGLVNDPNHANMVRGYFWSIVFMMSMPFLIMGGLSTYFYYEVCKARRLQVMNSAALPTSL